MRASPQPAPAKPSSPAARARASVAPAAGAGRSSVPSTPPVQAKLHVSRVDDPLEREADEVADRIMRMPAPDTGGGLLARELTHAVTRAGPGHLLQRQATGAVAEDPECDTSETNPVLWFEHDSTRLRVDGSVDSTVHLRSLIERVRGHDAASAGTGRVELRGFASAEGDAPHNLDLSRRRAERVRELLGEAGIASGRVSAVGLGESNSMPGREWNRRVEVCLTPRVETIDMPPEVVTAGVDCAHPPAAVTVLTDYAMLVTCVERALPALTPRDILTLLRQTYYRGGHWPEVIGCATPAGSAARGTLRTSHRTLYDTLAASKVVSGVDLGHVFTGLEATVCPTPDVEIEIPGPNVIVAMPNEEFATWGGDLGSAAASRTHDEVDLGVIHGWSHYFGTAGAMASFEDLRGDIDAFALRAELAGHCGATRMTTLPSLTTPISQLLLNYYGPGPSLTAADRFSCTVEALGGTVVGGAITNKTALVSAMTPRVESFARTFYLSLVTVPLFAIGPLEAILLRRYSREASALFVDWLETGL
jgi:outer membrane protein OmpA-like peptidoglycan-associated protein